MTKSKKFTAMHKELGCMIFNKKCYSGDMQINIDNAQPSVEIVKAGDLQPNEIPLIAEAGEASYNSQKNIATIRINHAFPLATKIKEYTGAYISLIYKGHIVDIFACPIIKVPLKQIKRDFPNIFQNTVDLHISGISQKTADTIEASKCLQIDTPTVRALIE